MGGGISSLETVHKLRLRRFSRLFWPLFDSNCRGHIRELIWPLQFELENRLKRTRKSTEAKIVDSLLHLSSLQKTRLFGNHFARLLKPNSILALSGELGAGKTSFVQGLASGLGIDSPIQSPTFIYLNIYEEGKIPLYHFDLYRINDGAAFFAMGFEEYFQKGGITVIEWPEKLGNAPLPPHILLRFSHEKKGRSVSLSSSFEPELLHFLSQWH